MFFFNDNEIINGLKKYPVLKNFSESALRRLVDESEIITLEQNQILFACGEPANTVFYLIEGHLDGFSSNKFTKKIMSFRAGELVGEVDVVAGESRGLTIKATRTSSLMKIDQQIFIKYFQKNPDLFMVLAQSMARRLRNTTLKIHESSYEYKNIGLIALSSDLPIEEIKQVFMPQVTQDGFNFHDKQQFELSGHEPINYFHQCQFNSGINLFFCVNADDLWSHAVINHVDYIYLITKDGTWNELPHGVITSIRQRPCDLAILHETPPPFENTARFYEQYPFKRHHHLMKTRADYERLYRYMTGQAIGLVVSGGGLRGFAHYGLIKALLESKIPIDYIGGSSMGALTAAMLAIDYNWENFDTLFTTNMMKVKKTIFLKNLTLPFVSILSGKTLTNSIREILGAYKIEDLKTNYFCVVSNLSSSKKEIITSGELWEWVRASTSIPGIAPPFEKNGIIYVDGGVCSNLPINDMRKLLDDVGQIIAFNLQIPPFKEKKYQFPPILSMWSMILYAIGLKKYRYTIPSILDILTEAPLINQYYADSEAAKTAQVMISPDTSSHTLISKNSDALIQPAYELAQKEFAKHCELFKRWINN